MVSLCLQYLGSQTPPVVKEKIKKLLYSWKVGLPGETKIAEAYEMLKKEGTSIVNEEQCVCVEQELNVLLVCIFNV